MSKLGSNELGGKLDNALEAFICARDSGDIETARASKLKFLEEAAPYIEVSIQRAAVVAAHDITRKDLTQAAVATLSKAVDTLPSNKYSSAKNFVIGVLRRAIGQRRSEFWGLLGKRRQGMAKKMEADIAGTAAILHQRLGRPPTCAELAGYMGMATDEFAVKYSALTLATPDQIQTKSSAQQPIEEGPDIHDICVDRAKAAAIYEAISHLPEELQVVAAIMGQDCRASDVAAELEIDGKTATAKVHAVKKAVLSYLRKEYYELFEEEFSRAKDTTSPEPKLLVVR
jgi:DNA-directed RNA polymerase specialized sigma subunit